MSHSGCLWQIEWHSELDSTMVRAGELAEQGAPSGTVVVADYQRAGRGTRGRTWIAPPRTCLMFTVLGRPRLAVTDLELLPLRVAECVATALRTQLGVDCLVKHPNDVVIDGKKLCGILCSSRVAGDEVQWVLSGIGLNTTMATAELPTVDATSLAILGGRVPPHEQLLEMLLDELVWLVEV